LAKLSAPPWEIDPVEYLIDARFPNLKVFVALNVNPDTRVAGIVDAAKAYRHELKALPREQVKELVAAQLDSVRAIAREKAEREEQERWFNQPGAKANLDHWAKMSYWTIDEAVALSLGREPKSASWKYIQTLVGTSPFATEFSAKRELAMRANVMGQLTEQCSPSTFLAWAERMRFPMPDVLVSGVKDLGIQIADWKSLFEQMKKSAEEAQEQLKVEHAAHMATMTSFTQQMFYQRKRTDDLAEGYEKLTAQQVAIIDQREAQVARLTAKVRELETLPKANPEKTLNVRERESLLKLVIGVAIKGYAFDPTAGRSPTAKEIASDLALVGIGMDEDTVRKYLAEAKELLPRR
jgi:hypothetical protein